MRILLDTNVLARAAMPGSGLGRALLMRCTGDPHVLVMSEFMFSELSRVLRYPRVQKAHGLTDQGIEDYLFGLKSAGVMAVIPDEPPAVVTADPEDDPIVATAIAGQVRVICSLDRHFHQPEVVMYCRAHGIDVVTDVELMRRLREGDER